MLSLRNAECGLQNGKSRGLIRNPHSAMYKLYVNNVRKCMPQYGGSVSRYLRRGASLRVVVQCLYTHVDAFAQIGEMRAHHL